MNFFFFFILKCNNRFGISAFLRLSTLKSMWDAKFEQWTQKLRNTCMDCIKSGLIEIDSNEYIRWHWQIEIKDIIAKWRRLILNSYANESWLLVDEMNTSEKKWAEKPDNERNNLRLRARNVPLYEQWMKHSDSWKISTREREIKKSQFLFQFSTIEWYISI